MARSGAGRGAWRSGGGRRAEALFGWSHGRNGRRDLCGSDSKTLATAESISVLKPPAARTRKSRSDPMLIAKDITKSYPTPRGELSILSGISLTLTRGDAIAIMGPSGSGKSTLLYILGALEPPTAGVVTLDGQNPFDFGEREQAAFRNKHIGFVF